MISVGQIVGNYKVTAKLGEGGMGVVFLAEHPVIGRKVALKVIHTELSRNPEVISRFMTEAKSVNQIGNEHIVDINDFGNTTEGEFYFVMEFLQGEALADRMKREHQLQMARALKIGAQVADALAASHDHGIIHRDLKPENIYLITRGSNNDFVKVLDFGLAKLTQGDDKVSHKTRTGSVMGTPYYMSPEQCEGKASVDHRADIYSLGVIMFEMMTGKVPFGGEGYGEIIVKHITQPPPSARAINPLVEEAHEAVLMRAMAKSRDDRFQSMAEFRAAMLDPEGYLANAPAIAPSESDLAAEEVRGGRTPSPQTLGADSRPVPTTFRHGAGEIGDDFEEMPRSRKGLVFGVVGGVAAAAVVAVLVLRGGDQPAADVPGSTTAPVAVPADPPVPAAPEKAMVNFTTVPSGATVTVEESGLVLGVTPLDKEFPVGKAAVKISFALAGYQKEIESFVPAEGAKVSADLEKVPVVTPPVKPAVDRVAADRNKDKGHPVKGKGKGKRPAVLDEDAVLEPNFN